MLAAYVDGRLGSDELARISTHLVDCDRCYETVAATVRFLAGGARTENVAPPWALAPAILTATVMAAAMTIGLLLLGQGS